MRQLLKIITFTFLFFITFCLLSIPITCANDAINTSSSGWLISDGITNNGTSYTHPESLYDRISTSFLNLPLWVQVLSLSIIFISALITLIKIVPFSIGRLKNVLDNEKRQAILKYVQENPGCTVADIVDTQNINRGTVKYHVFQLELKGKIFQKRAGKFSRLFHKTTQIRDIESTVTPYLRNDTSKSILKAILEKPGITNQELSSMFNLDKSTIHWYLQKFDNDGIIEFKQAGKFRQCVISEDAKMVLLRFMPA